MGSKMFSNGDELFDFLVANGPSVDEHHIEHLRGAENADAIYDYLVEAMGVAPEGSIDDLFETVRDNIRLVGGDEYSFELADFVGAPWDCFA